MKLKINLNETVEVVLTEAGAEAYNKRWYELKIPEKYRREPVKAGHVLKMHVHEMMNEFGPSVHLGMRSPFENFSITFDTGVK